jgi:hypothetical protein
MGVVEWLNEQGGCYHLSMRVADGSQPSLVPQVLLGSVVTPADLDLPVQWFGRQHHG